MTHDPCCPLDDMPDADCTICTAITAARGQEKNVANDTWKANLPLIERRNYEQGFRDGLETGRKQRNT